MVVALIAFEPIAAGMVMIFEAKISGGSDLFARSSVVIMLPSSVRRSWECGFIRGCTVPFAQIMREAEREFSRGTNMPSYFEVEDGNTGNSGSDDLDEWGGKGRILRTIENHLR
jgi:hypothetical protein